MEEESANKKIPNAVLSTLLFLFFYRLIRTAFRDIPALLTNWYDSVIAEDEPLGFNLALAILFVIWIVLSFWSIIHMLKGKPDGVVCIRWALGFGILVSLCSGIQTLGKAVAIHWVYALLPIIQLFVSIVFLIYLAKSKFVKQTYPVYERRFAPGGWIWIAYLVVFVGVLAWIMAVSVDKSGRTRAIPIAELNIPENHICDGRILFKTNVTWDTVGIELEGYDDIQEVVCYNHGDDSAKTYVWSGVSKKKRHVDYMAVLLQVIPFETSWPVQEGRMADFTFNHDQCYLEQYICETDSLNILWTFAMRFDSSSDKYYAFSRVRRSSSINNIIGDEFEYCVHSLKTVFFDLTPYKK